MAKTKGELIVGPAELPGGVAMDEGMLDQAVQDLNNIYSVKGLETAKSIGDYVVDSFFGGDLAQARKSGKKHVSYRALAKREDLLVSYSFISNSVALLEQLKQLPEDVSSSLTWTHHKLLLPVKNEKTKLKLAKRAVNKGLTKRALGDEVRAAREMEKGSDGRGRPTLPTYVKGLKDFAKAVDKVTSDELVDEVFTKTPMSETDGYLQTLGVQIKRMEAFRGRLSERLNEWKEHQAELAAKAQDEK